MRPFVNTGLSVVIIHGFLSRPSNICIFETAYIKKQSYINPKLLGKHIEKQETVLIIIFVNLNMIILDRKLLIIITIQRPCGKRKNMFCLVKSIIIFYLMTLLQMTLTRTSLQLVKNSPVILIRTICLLCLLLWAVV